jgi:hypothetical protein
VGSASRLYRVNLGVGGLGAAILALALASAWRLVNIGLPSPDDLLYACRHVIFSGETVISLAVLTLTGIGAAVLVLAARSTAHNYRAQRLVLSKLSIQYEAEYRGVGLIVFTHDRPEAFTAGLLRPRLYLSSDALRAENTELAAVIEHEFYHCHRYDPLRLLIVQVLSDAFFFLPAVRRLSDRYNQLAELAADDAAVSKGASRGTLASALLTFGEGARPGVVGIAPERVDHLCGDDTRWKFPTTLVASTLVTLTALWALAITLLFMAAPKGFGVAGLSAQVCMVAMAAVPGACSNPMDILPFTVGLCLMAIAYLRWRRVRA